MAAWKVAQHVHSAPRLFPYFGDPRRQSPNAAEQAWPPWYVSRRESLAHQQFDPVSPFPSRPVRNPIFGR